MFQRDFREPLQLQCAMHGIFSHTLAPVTLDQTLDGVEQVRPHGLRAEISAPDPSADRIHQKECNGSDNQQPGKIVDLLRPQLDEKEIEPAIWDIDQNCLAWSTQTTVPSDERQQIVDAETE